MRVKEYIKDNQNPFILSTDYDVTVPWKTADFQTALANYIRISHGNLRVRPSLVREEAEHLPEWIRFSCSNLYTINAYKYKHLYDTTVAEYDPIENYRMIEEEESEHVEEEAGTLTKGSQTDSTSKSSVFGSKQDSVLTQTTIGSHVDNFTEETEFGEVTVETDNISTKGQQENENSITDTIGGVRVSNEKLTTNPNEAISNTHYVSTFESQTLYVESKDEADPTRQITEHINPDTHVTEETEGERIDVLDGEQVTSAHTDEVTRQESYGSRVDSNEDTLSYGSHTDTETGSVTSGQRIDSDSKEASGTSSRTLTRSGNIGVTTSQQMILSEREVALFSLYEVIAKDILGIIALRVYGG